MNEPIHNLEAERAVLGAMLTSHNVIDEVAEVLTGADFYQPRHETIFDAIVEAHSTGQRPDPMLISTILGSSDLARIGGAPYLLDLTSLETIPTPAHAPHYAAKVRDAAASRRIIEATASIVQRVHAGGEMGEVAEDARRLLHAAVTQTKASDNGIDADRLMVETLDELEGEHDPGLPTGWADLDHYVNGLRAGQLAIVGARPSVGKSVIAANIAANACRAGVGVHFASLEMRRSEVMQRLIAAHTTIDLGRLVNHSLTESDWSRIAAKASEIQSWPLWVDDQGSQSLAQVRARAKRTARVKGLGLVVVDYLQLMAPRSRAIPREQQVGELSEGLKALAKELDVPVLALAQVNRGSAERTDKRPQMSDLRESGRIEADADHVWLLHRQDLVDPRSTTGDLEVIVAKNRNGSAGATVTLGFQGHYSRAVSKAWTPTGAIA